MPSLSIFGWLILLSLGGAGVGQPTQSPTPATSTARHAEFQRLLTDELGKCAREANQSSSSSAESLTACRRRAFQTAGIQSRFIICPGDSRCDRERRAAGVR